MGDSFTRVDPRGRALPVEGLDEAAVALYGRLAQGGKPTPEDGPALARLRAWGMIGADDTGTEQPPVLPPTDAAWTLSKAALIHLESQLRQLAELPRTIEKMKAHFEGSRFQSGMGAEFLADRDEINERIGAVLAGAQHELLGAHPQGPRSREQMEIGIPRDTAALARGVKYRTLYQDAVRDDVVTCEWASTMAPRGSQFRTLVDPFDRIIIIDRRVAVIPDYAMPDSPEGAAWIITSLPMVAFARHAFDQQWRRATAWHGERRAQRRAGAPGVLEDVHKVILQCLAEDDSLEKIARGLRTSKRTVQRKLDEVRALWGVPGASHAKLTFMWGRSLQSAPEPGGTLDLEQAA